MAIDSANIDSAGIDSASLDSVLDNQGSGGNEIVVGWNVVDSGSISTSLVDTSNITDTYEIYRIALYNVTTGTDDTEVELTIYLGGAEQTSGYSFQSLEGNSFTTSQTAGAIPLTETSANGGLGSAAGEVMFGDIYIYDPATSNVSNLLAKMFYINASGQPERRRVSGFNNTTGVLDGFKIAGAGGETLSGSYVIYGLNLE